MTSKDNLPDDDAELRKRAEETAGEGTARGKARRMSGRWRYVWVLAMGFMIAGALILSAIWEADRQKRLRMDFFRQDLSELARICEVIIADRLREFDNSLLVLRDDFAADPKRFQENIRLLRSGPLADPEIYVVLVDREGYLTYTDAPNVKPGLYRGDQPYFRYFAGGGKDIFYISEPVFGRVTNRYSIPLVRPIYDKQGGLLGVVALSVRQDFLANFGARLQLSGDTTVTVVTHDGAVAARSRDLEKVQGTKLLPELLAPMLTGSEGVFSSPFTQDGLESIFAYRHMAGLPLIVYVASSPNPVLREISMQRNVLLSGSSFTSLVILVLMVVYLQRRKITEQFIAVQGVRLKEAQRIAGMGSWELDLETLNFHWSDEAYHLFGISRETFKPNLENFLSLIPEPDRAAVRAGIEQAVIEGRFSVEHRVLRGDGRLREMVEHGEVLLSAAGKVAALIGTVQDITERKRSEEEMVKLEARLQQAQKMESIGTLAGGIAHDFNNILFPLVGFAELLKDDIPAESPLQGHIDEILHAALRSRELVKQILAFSRKADQSVQPIQLHPIIKEALKLLRSSIPTTIDIQQNIDSHCGIVMADPTQVHQIVMNLATNAYHAMEAAGGRLNVGLKQVELASEPDRSVFQTLMPGKYALLTVSDTGMGIEKEILNKIFDPYFTTKGVGKGTGLGLSVVHGIVTAHKGEILIDSSPGKGTEIRVYLPVVEQMAEDQGIGDNEPIPGGKEKILLVDDEAAIVRLEQQMLERLGYHIEAHTGSLDALQAFRADPDAFDLVITDMTMPNMTGDRLTTELVLIRPGVPVIICTGFSDKIDKESAIAMGIKGFLMKPVIKSEMAKMVRKVLDEAFNRRGTLFISLLLLFCLLPSGAWCAPLEKVRLQLKWYHQFQFAGYYAAKDKGFYRDEGLDAELIEGSRESSPYEMVLGRKADFGVQDGGDLIYHRLQGEPLIAVAAIFQHSPTVLVSKKSSGVCSPTDLVGRTVMISPNRGSAQILAMFRREGVKVKSDSDQEPVRFMPLSWKLEDLVEGRVDAIQGYITSEMLLLRKLHGIEPAALSPLEYGIDFYGDALFTSAEILKEKPDLVARFRRASLKGWAYAMANPAEIVDMILPLPSPRRIRPDRETLLGEAGAMNHIVLPTLVEIGSMNPGRWERMAQIFLELGMVTSTSNLKGFIYEVDAEKQEIIRKLRLLGIVLGCIGLVAVVSLFWVRLLRSRVNLRTKELREREEKYRNLFNNAEVGIFRSRLDGSEVMEVNLRFLDIVGMTLEETLGKPSVNLWADPKEREEMAKRLIADGSVSAFEYKMLNKRQGEVRNCLTSLRLYREQGILEGSILDITDRKRAEEALRASLAEKEVLVKEVHHRVKNNLAAIKGLLDLKGRTINDASARTALAELSERIRSMALVHEQLYQSEDFSRIDFQYYLDTLTAHLRSSYSDERHGDIHVSVAAKGVEMGLDIAVPCGLLITELVTNALKYAFPEGRPAPGAGRCDIAVSAEWDGTAYTLSVADNGVGLPADLDWTKAKTMGLGLVRMLGQHQLQGRVELDRTGGTRFRLRFAPAQRTMMSDE